MNKLIKVVNSIVRQNPSSKINLVVLNNCDNICKTCKNNCDNIPKTQNIPNNNHLNNIKFTATEELEIKYLERKSLEFAIKN